MQTSLTRCILKLLVFKLGALLCVTRALWPGICCILLNLLLLIYFFIMESGGLPYIGSYTLHDCPGLAFCLYRLRGCRNAARRLRVGQGAAELHLAVTPRIHDWLQLPD